jgi:hypothetical protein
MGILNKLWDILSGDDKDKSYTSRPLNSSSTVTKKPPGKKEFQFKTAKGEEYRFKIEIPEGELAQTIITEKKRIRKEVGYNAFKYSLIPEYESLKNGDGEFKKSFIFHLIDEAFEIEERIRYLESSREDYWEYTRNFYSAKRELLELLKLIIRSKQSFNDQDYMHLFSEYKNKQFKGLGFGEWPIGFSLMSLENFIKKNGFSEDLKSFMLSMLEWEEFTPKYRNWGSDLEKAKNKIQKILKDYGGVQNEDGLHFQFNKGPIGDRINEDLNKLTGEEKASYCEILHLCAQATSSSPTKKFLTEINTVMDKIGLDKYKKQVSIWFEYFIKTEPSGEERHGGYMRWSFADLQNLKVLRSMVWTFVRFHDSSTLQLIGQMATKGYKKIQYVGPTSSIIGNAAVYTLANSKGLEGVSQLTKLKVKVTKPSIKKTIDKHLTKLSEKRNLSISQIEEMAVPDFGLTDGEITKTFGDFKLNFKITGIGKTEMSWIKPDGGTQKSVPGAVKDSKPLNDKLKKFKKDTAEIKKVISAHRDRIDNSYLEQRVWDLDAIQKYYFNHGLISFLAKRLIWEVYENDKLVTSFYWGKDAWKDVNDKPVDFIKLKDPKFKLWHPIAKGIDEVLAWRDVIMKNEMVQPFKQAFREIYVLTDAEMNTKTYSNRMAAHVLKQHQFNALAGLRGWKFTLMGAWDHGFDGIAQTEIKSYNLKAQYWTQEINDGNMSDSGIWNYISTDQIRFLDENDEVMELEKVPPLVFSEIFRDVDMFVGVCSVGNDPEWADNGGMPQYRNYWHQYSFGDLTEMANTRKAILENIVPKLKIKNVASVDGKFLIVKGKLTTYKIHIGSGNILMEPNDQYLCIVPDGKKANKGDKVFLPFDGDRTLTVILSKAFLLASDDKITDSTITSQINRKLN